MQLSEVLPQGKLLFRRRTLAVPRGKWLFPRGKLLSCLPRDNLLAFPQENGREARWEQLGAVGMFARMSMAPSSGAHLPEHHLAKLIKIVISLIKIVIS